MSVCAEALCGLTLSARQTVDVPPVASEHQRRTDGRSSNCPSGGRAARGFAARIPVLLVAAVDRPRAAASAVIVKAAVGVRLR